MQPAEKEPDADVWALVQGNQRDRALVLLMQRHGPAVARYCRAALDDDAQTDDVLQQVFIEVHRDLHKFAGRSALKGWIFGIARHRVLDQKRVTRRTLSRRRELRTTAADPGPLANERIDQVQLQRALGECVEGLGEHVQTALFLRYQQGFSFEDMAAVCKEKAGTLQARVARALPVLRDCIKARTGGSL